MVETHVGALVGRLAVIIRQGVDEGTIRADDAATAARALFHAMSASTTRFTPPTGSTPDMAPPSR
jgi:Tetracyclin repressor-like, C-terminal domain